MRSVALASDADATQLSAVLWGLSALMLSLAAGAAALAHLRFAHMGAFTTQIFYYFGILVTLRVYALWRGLDDARLRVGLDLAVTFALNALAGVMLQYSAATVPAPDVTPLVQRADRALGFDWFAYAAYVGSIKPLSFALSQVYAGWMAGMVAAMAALAWRRRFDTIGEYALGFTLANLTIIGLFALIDGHSLEAAAAHLIPGFHAPGGTSPRVLHALLAFRAGAQRTLDFNELWPMVSFPSLHGATAILLIAATRDLKAWRYPFLAFNILVLISTLSEGGHNITDVVAGALVAYGAILAAPPLYRALGRGAPARAAAAPVPAPG